MPCAAVLIGSDLRFPWWASLTIKRTTWISPLIWSTCPGPTARSSQMPVRGEIQRLRHSEDSVFHEKALRNLEKGRLTEWKNEQILEAIRNFQAAHGRPPRYKELRTEKWAPRLQNDLEEVWFQSRRHQVCQARSRFVGGLVRVLLWFIDARFGQHLDPESEFPPERRFLFGSKKLEWLWLSWRTSSGDVRRHRGGIERANLRSVLGSRRPHDLDSQVGPSSLVSSL